MINRVTCLLTPRDEKEFAKAIEFLLDNPDVAAKIGEKGYLFLKKEYSMEKSIKNLVKNIYSLLKKSKQ